MWGGQNKTKTKQQKKKLSSRFTPISQKKKAFIHRRDLTSDWCWSWNSNTLATWCEELTHLKRPWCWERLKAGGEGDDRGGDGWMASPTQWTWVWVKSGSWWWTGKPGLLQSMVSKRVVHDWVTEPQKRGDNKKEELSTAHCCFQNNFGKKYLKSLFELVRMAIIKKPKNNKCWRERGDKGTLLHYWWECELI